MSVFTSVKRSRQWGVLLVAGLLAAACVSDRDLQPVEPPEMATTTSPPPVSVRVDGDSIFLPDDLYPTQIGLAASKYWILTQVEPIDPDTPGAEIGTLLAVDVDSGRVLSELILEDFPSRLLTDEQGVWVAHWGSGAITRIDPDSAEVVAIIDLELPFDFGNGPDKRLFIPNDMDLGHGSLWVGTARGAVARIDLATNEVEIIELDPGAPGEIAVDEDGIWIAEDVGGLRHINAGTGEETRIGLDDLDHSVSQLLVVEDDLYAVGDRLARTQDGDFRIDAGSYLASEKYSLSRVSLSSMTVADTVQLPYGVAFLGWVDGVAGLIDVSEAFHELEATPGLLDEVFQTNSRFKGRLPQQTGREAWLIDTVDPLVRRIRLTTSSGFALPFSVEDHIEPRPISDDAAVSSDWVELDRGLIEPRWPALALWTGEEVVIWGGEPRGGGLPLEGGAAYRPATDTWRMMSDSPLGAVSEPGWVWTGRELVIWEGRGEAAAWQPEDNTWRIIEDWPLAGWFYRRSVWTGEEILDVFRDLAVDPITGKSRPIAVSPPLHQRASMVWADGYMVSATGEGSYDPASNSWTEMPPSGLTPLATDGTAVGSQVVAVDYAMSASVFDPDTNSWSALPAVPLRFFECAPRARTFGARVVVEHCAGLAVLDPDWRGWTPLAYPLGNDTHPPTVITTGEDIYVLGTGFFRLKAGAIDNPSRIALGISYLDLPDGWSLQQTGAHEDISAEVAVESSDGEVCFALERHVSAEGQLRLLMRHDPIVTSVTPYVGGEPVNALRLESGSLDDLQHLVWASSTSDVVDIACPDFDTLMELAPRVWSPWQ